VFDPEGYPVVVGGPSASFNIPDNGETYLGYVHLRSYEEVDNYMSDAGQYWRNHEHWHMKQVLYYFHGSDRSWAKEIGIEYAAAGFKHDQVPLEIDADNHNGDPFRPYQDPWAGNMRPRPSWAKKGPS
jgi:hypothetical protein